MQGHQKSTNPSRSLDPVHTFRILRPDDAHELAMLHASVFTTPWSPAALRDELTKPTVFGLALLASDQTNRIISFVLFQRALDEAEMLTLATDPAFQKQGNAKALLATAFMHLTERGIIRCLLDVAADNAPAIALYESLRFHKDGRRKAYYKRHSAPPVDAILMHRDMTGLP